MKVSHNNSIKYIKKEFVTHFFLRGDTKERSLSTFPLQTIGKKHPSSLLQWRMKEFPGLGNHLKIFIEFL
jgi:hypothetical protein